MELQLISQNDSVSPHNITTGIGIGAIELAVYFFVSYNIRKYWYTQLKHINVISYYWMTMTVLTCIWECAFILQYQSVHEYAEELVVTNTHVWTQKYNVSDINPWKLSKIFYAEYGAHADREYIQLHNYWSRLIEGSHAGLCGLFSLLAIIFSIHNKSQLYIISATVAMSSQLMNSILYMGQYFLQVSDPSSVNYPSASFPCGFALLARAFMYVNVFWTVMPLYTIIMEYVSYLYHSNINKIKKQYSENQKSDMIFQKIINFPLESNHIQQTRRYQRKQLNRRSNNEYKYNEHKYQGYKYN
jgi:hypothetical protein